jgi:hypothetical protein
MSISPCLIRTLLRIIVDRTAFFNRNTTPTLHIRNHSQTLATNSTKKKTPLGHVLAGQQPPPWLSSTNRPQSQSGLTTKTPTGQASATMSLRNISMTMTSSGSKPTIRATEAAQTTRAKISLTSQGLQNKATKLLVLRLYLPGNMPAYTRLYWRPSSPSQRRAWASGSAR